MPRQFEWGNQGAGLRLRHRTTDTDTSTTDLPRSLMKSPRVSGVMLAPRPPPYTVVGRRIGG